MYAKYVHRVKAKQNSHLDIPFANNVSKFKNNKILLKPRKLLTQKKFKQS